jgi:O-antigen/teichoic acid export membrane protein
VKLRSLPSRFTRDFAATLLGQVGVVGFSVLSSVLAARLLGPRGRGELAAIILWPMLLAFLFSIGMDQSIVFHVGKKVFDISEVWTASLVVGLGLSSCAVLVGLWVIPKALRLYSPEVRHLTFVFLAFVPLIWLTALPNGFLQGTLDVGNFSLLRVLSASLYAVGLLGLYLANKPSVEDALAVQICALLLVSICGFWIVICKNRPRWVWNFKSCKSLLNFGWKTQLGSLATYVNQRLDQLILSMFMPPRDLGLYVVAVAVAMSAGFFPKAAGIVTLATGSNSEFDRAKDVTAKSFGATLVALLVGCTALYVICPWLITFAFGPSFTPAVTACRILLPGSIALGLSQVLFNGARALNHPMLPSYAEGLAVVVTGLSLYLLLPQYGFVGAAIASTLAYVSSLVFSLMFFHQHKEINFTFSELSHGALAGCRAITRVASHPRVSRELLETSSRPSLRKQRQSGPLTRIDG